MAPLEATNLTTACVVVAVLLALLTPLADPVRMSVAAQLRRLDQGRVTPEAFDFQFLRFDAGRAGIEALERLQARGGIGADGAGAALQQRQRRDPDPVPLAIPAFPAGRVVPHDVLALSAVRALRCDDTANHCEAIFIDLDADGAEDILLRVGMFAILLQASSDGAWREAGTLSIFCAGDAQALREGRFTLAAPAFRDLDMGRHRLRLSQPDVCP
ncbi:hypothetical protein ACQW02_05565 [Humitalea sp. 24SJ18S-53]|uniref:hypothetical protein n=1 Tax=Humitalea sp. 24SJ18S-53 TaxID=3422307 RepID=UPI003D677711